MMCGKERAMGKTLLVKEIRNHLLSFRFLAVSVLLIVIVPITVLVLTNDTIRKQDDYSRRQTDIQNYLAHYAHFNRLSGIIQPSQTPLPFQALVRGLSDDPGLNLFDNDPLPVLFPLIDLTFILAILLSLAALIFSYDAISGEKEDGTLKLMLANQLSRSRIIWAKIAGGLTTLFIPFLVSLAVGLILILLNRRIAWRGSDWGALGLILLGGTLYLGIFLGVGILVSSRHASSSSSILTCLFLWVLFVLVVPNLSPYVASLIHPAPSLIKVGREIDRMTDTERDDLGRKLARESGEAVIKANPILKNVADLSEPQIKAEIERDPAFARAYDLLRKGNEAAWREANDIQDAKAKTLRDDLARKEKIQTEFSVGLSMVSPLAAFTYFAADLANAGARNQAHFQTISRVFWTSYGDYRDRRMEAMRKANPTADIWNTAVDVRDMPRFVYQEEPLAARFGAVALPLVVLIAMALGVFLAAVLSFNRYDVR
jgi:ABC-type transport system involved in multi-copper enzyme maturation permease subunit